MTPFKEFLSTFCGVGGVCFSSFFFGLSSLFFFSSSSSLSSSQRSSCMLSTESRASSQTTSTKTFFLTTHSIYFISLFVANSIIFIQDLFKSLDYLSNIFLLKTETVYCFFVFFLKQKPGIFSLKWTNNQIPNTPVVLLLSAAPPSAPLPPGSLRPALGQEVSKCRGFRRPLAVV